MHICVFLLNASDPKRNKPDVSGALFSVNKSVLKLIDCGGFRSPVAVLINEGEQQLPVRVKCVKRNREMLKENPFFKIKELPECDRQCNGNKTTFLFFPCGPVPNDPRTGTSLRPGGLGTTELDHLSQDYLFLCLSVSWRLQVSFICLSELNLLIPRTPSPPWSY